MKRTRSQAAKERWKNASKEMREKMLSKMNKKGLESPFYKHIKLSPTVARLFSSETSNEL